MEKEYLYSGSANLSRGIEGVGGKLELTRDAIIFKPHALNIQREELYIALADVKEIAQASSLGIVPNAINIGTDIDEFKFVVHNRKEWLDRITAQIRRMNE